MSQKLTESSARRKFKLLNLILLSPYEGYDNRVLVRCSKCEHERQVLPRNVFTKRPNCPECARRAKLLPADHVISTLKNKGITLMSKYVSSGHQSKLKCKCGHIWNTTLTQILHSGTGCPRCACNIKYTTEEIQNKISSNITIEGVYKGMNSPLLVKCNVGHVWSTSASNLVHQHGKCPTCYPYQHNKKFGRRVVIDNIVFSSELEAECYKIAKSSSLTLERQKKYPHNPRMRCDFYYNGLWIEVSSFKNERYLNKIKQKREVITSLGYDFTFISSVDAFCILVKTLEDR